MEVAVLGKDLLWGPRSQNHRQSVFARCLRGSPLPGLCKGSDLVVPWAKIRVRRHGETREQACRNYCMETWLLNYMAEETHIATKVSHF